MAAGTFVRLDEGRRPNSFLACSDPADVARVENRTFICSQTAAEDVTDNLRFDPMAMLPFCGYHMGDYFAHWLAMGETGGTQMPRIFYVNWFRKSVDGAWLWPGFGDNIRVLKWVVERIEGKAAAVDTPIGRIPTADALDLSGMEIEPAVVQELLRVEAAEWRSELPKYEAHLQRFGSKLPPQLREELMALRQRLSVF